MGNSLFFHSSLQYPFPVCAKIEVLLKMRVYLLKGELFDKHCVTTEYVI